MFEKTDNTGVTGSFGPGEQVESRQCWRHYRSSHYQRVTYYVTMRSIFHAHEKGTFSAWFQLAKLPFSADIYKFVVEKLRLL